jgi:hypothetical protein
MVSLPIVGSSAVFDDCPAYYLREGYMDLPAVHLMEDGTHPASLVGEWAMEVESGARSIETLSPKGRELVHLYLRERNSRDKHRDEMRREKRGNH